MGKDWERGMEYNDNEIKKQNEKKNENENKVYLL